MSLTLWVLLQLIFTVTKELDVSCMVWHSENKEHQGWHSTAGGTSMDLTLTSSPRRSSTGSQGMCRWHYGLRATDTFIVGPGPSVADVTLPHMHITSPLEPRTRTLMHLLVGTSRGWRPPGFGGLPVGDRDQHGDV